MALTINQIIKFCESIGLSVTPPRPNRVIHFGTGEPHSFESVIHRNTTVAIVGQVSMDRKVCYRMAPFSYSTDKLMPNYQSLARLLLKGLENVQGANIQRAVIKELIWLKIPELRST